MRELYHREHVEERENEKVGRNDTIDSQRSYSLLCDPLLYDSTSSELNRADNICIIKR